MRRAGLTRWVVRVAAALIVGTSLFAGAATATAAPATSNGSTALLDANTPGSQWLASCLNSGRTLSVLFVLDVSGSLDGTDPQGLRYDGLEIALTTLATAKPADGSEVTIEAAVAAFGNRWYSPGSVAPWQRINIDSPAPLIGDMVNRARAETEWRDDGTLFSTIFEPAIDELTQRGPENCRAIVWFTDGDNDPTDPSADMCRVGGVIDEVRENGIVLIGLRLGSTTDPLMATMALGSDSGQSCGTNPIPEGWAPGIYLAADDVQRLFASIQSIVEGCTVTEGLHVDPGIRRVRVNIYHGVDSVRFDLPGNISFTAGTNGSSGPFDGIHVTSTREGFYVSMELSLPPGVGVGDWLLSSTVPLADGDVEFCVFSDLHLAVDEDSMARLEAGVPGVLTVNVLDPDDLPADLSVFTTSAVAASLIGPDGQPRTVEASLNPNGHDIDLLIRTEPTDARLDLEVTLTLTTQSGLTLTPLRLETPVVTGLNEYYPTVTPLDVLELGEALREDPASAQIEMTGSAKGPSSVCFGPPEDVVVPPTATDADPMYPVGCIDLAPGEVRVVTVAVSTTTAVEGDGSAKIPMELHAAPDPSGFEGVAELRLPVEWRFSNPLNAGILIGGILAIVALSLLMPYLAILWANWVTARFDVTSIQWEPIDVSVDTRDVRRTVPLKGGSDGLVGGVRDAGIRGRRSVFFGRRRFARSFQIDEVSFKSKVYWNPFRAPLFWAEVPEGKVLLTTFSSVAAVPGAANTARVAPAFDAAVLLIVDPATIPGDGPVKARAIALLSSARYGADATAAARRAGWPGRIAQLRSARKNRSGTDTVDDARGTRRRPTPTTRSSDSNGRRRRPFGNT